MEIKKTSPFIKQGLLLSADAIQEESILARIKLEDLQFEPKSIGKGSYGTVQIATHKPSGIQVAVKKIEKSSLKSAKMKETLKREI